MSVNGLQEQKGESMNAMQVFNHGDVSVEVIEVNGQQLFNATQIGAGLYITPSGVRTALKNMEEIEDYILVTNSMLDDYSNVTISDIRRIANRGETFLTESGVYEMIIQSRKTEAKSFRRWITRDVIPSIRKTGSYGAGVPENFAEALQLAANQQRAIADQQAKLQIQAPKVESFDRYMDASGTMSMNLAGKILGIGQNNLFKLLREKKVLMNYPSPKGEKHPKRDLHNQPYQAYVDRGWFITKPGSYTRDDSDRPIGHSETTRVTTRGLDGISRLMAKQPGQSSLFAKQERISFPEE